MEELRAVVFELRPASLEAEGLATVLRKHVDVLRRVTGQRIELEVCDVPPAAPATATQVLRIAQEALGNALRHAGATRIEVRLGRRRHAVLRSTDDGCGFDPPARRCAGQRLGLTSMEERATELGGHARPSPRARRRHDRPPGGRRRRDPRPARRRPRRGAPGPAHVPRPPGGHRGRRRGRATARPRVDAARRTDPDVILLDLVMPRLDGVGALKRLRDTARARDRADELRRRRQALRGTARRRGGLPAQGRRARGARARDPRRARRQRAARRRRSPPASSRRSPPAAARRPRSTTSPPASATCWS